jgi:hypothetical protein
MVEPGFSVEVLPGEPQVEAEPGGAALAVVYAGGAERGGDAAPHNLALRIACQMRLVPMVGVHIIHGARFPHGDELMIQPDVLASPDLMSPPCWSVSAISRFRLS